MSLPSICNHETCSVLGGAHYRFLQQDEEAAFDPFAHMGALLTSEHNQAGSSLAHAAVTENYS